MGLHEQGLGAKSFLFFWPSESTPSASSALSGFSAWPTTMTLSAMAFPFLRCLSNARGLPVPVLPVEINCDLKPRTGRQFALQFLALRISSTRLRKVLIHSSRAACYGFCEPAVFRR